MKSEALGSIMNDAVVISKDTAKAIAKELGYHNLQAFVEDREGVICNLPEANENENPNFYGVDTLKWITNNGEVYPVIVIGGNTEDFKRFLYADEPTFEVFLKEHRLASQVGQGETFNKEVFKQIENEYRTGLIQEFFAEEEEHLVKNNE